ncbi:MAG: DUF1553 domain-containing protein, partial [Opitutaceae bacterium]|nr:DUF1553 domain-containing protein [Opitutaceae bacterium]
VKQLHRTIVLSATYRQSAVGHANAAAADPDNHLIYRFNRRRLEFEALRDTLLATSGTLDLRAGGLSDDLVKEPFPVRRTIYGFIDRQNLPGVFRTFDFPNPDVSSAQRFATTVPQQALFMLNSPFVQEQARALMRRPEVQAAKSDAEKIRTLHRLVLQRAPTADEQKLATAFIAASRPEPAPEPQPAAPPAPKMEPEKAKKKNTKNTPPPAPKAPTPPLTRWEELSQVLLLSNEVAFVD